MTMHRTLSDTEMEEVLQRQLYGHLGCTLPDGKVYVVPITYAYHDGALYAFSREGQKIDALRRNPSVCFQTEQFLHEGLWRSVIVWGTYEELSGNEQLHAAKMLFERLDREQGTATSPLYQPPAHTLLAGASRTWEEEDAIFYRLRIAQKTGKQVHYE